MTKKIPLTQDKFALVDDEDYGFLNQWKWHYHHTGYARRGERYRKACGKSAMKGFAMHRVINKTPDGMETDHINRNKLDNRKENLRSCTKSQNLMNSKKRKNTTSKYKGVSWKKGDKRWAAQIPINQKYTHLGYFSSETEAAKAYNKAAKEYHGEFAVLNII